MSKRIRVAVAGGTGYMGVESLRLLLAHPAVEVRRATSEQYAGRRLDEVYPAFRGRSELVLEPLDAARVGDAVDVVVAALPHGASARTVVTALEAGARVIDLSADFRLRDAAVFGRWYGEHPAPELLSQAVYGIPEFAREQIAAAKLVAVPGCYPTGALLALVPLARAGVIAAGGPVVVDSKSGASGAGRSAKTELLFSELDENVRAYGVGKHRHLPEITQELAAAGCTSRVVFTPHLLPLRRGLLSTIYVPIRRDADLAAAYQQAYGQEAFVQLLPPGSFPEVRDVRGTNHSQIGWAVLEGDLAIVISAIDNLGKGGAGQGVQCLNVMFGLDERTGLEHIAAVP